MISVRQSGETLATYVPSALRRISWIAVFAGVGIALVIQSMLSIHGHLHQFLMGVGVGIGTMGPTHIKTLATADLSGIPGLCWQSLGLVALLIGSGVASRVAEAPYRHEGMLHGLLTWGVVMLFTLCLPTTCLPTTALGSLMSEIFGASVATTQTVSQASFGMTTTPLVGAMVATLGGAIGTLRSL
jgi:hypothetical protein